MADAAVRKMTADEFFDWDSGDDRRYQLIDGVPVAMAPPSEAHAVLLAVLAQKLGEALDKRRPCTVRIPGAVRPAARNDRVWEPDLAVTCTPHRRGQKGTADPLLVVEILSPGTERGDRFDKLIDYQLVPSIEEIVLVGQDRMAAEVYRREGSTWTIELVAGANQSLRLRSISAEIPLGGLYERIDLA
jgi:Uma2 family endonuclease